jgi:hypothetical protein
VSSAQDEEILNWLTSGSTPDSAAVYNVLCDDSGVFRSDEGPLWDFKESWPFSLSDDYFAGLARARCCHSESNGDPEF